MSDTFPVDRDTVRHAEQILKTYKQGKSAMEHRIVDNELWFRMRHGAATHLPSDPSSTSGWLFNTIASKHADAMDNFPEPVILPREESDRDRARMLSLVLPEILEHCRFEDVYSDAWWYKLKHGAACYGIFWADDDIAVRHIDLLNLFYDNSVNDIQKSPNVFHVELAERDELEEEYPVLKDALSRPTLEITRYLYDDSVDTSKKAAVVDWYYKKNGLVHYCKFCAGEVLYASENDPELAEVGWYDHGLYPFVLDVLYPVSGTPVGFGLIDVLRDAQTYIDLLNSAMLKNAMMASHKRFFVRADGSVNEEEFSDLSRDFVHVLSASLGEDAIREVETRPLDNIYVSLLNNKVEEIKEVSGNRDFSAGGTAGGVTAASAIAALQEAGSKLSRDMVKSGYRAFSDIVRQIIELIRQFYDEPRTFRITAPAGEVFLPFENTDTMDPTVYDIRVSAAKASPFSRVSQNELACEFFRLGLFAPERREEALTCLSMMDFEGRDALLRSLRENAVQFPAVPTGGMTEPPDPMTAARMAAAEGVRV